MARIRAAVAVAALVLLALTPIRSVVDGTGPPIAYNSGNASERISTLPVGRTGEVDPRRTIYCIDIGVPPLAGEVIFAAADFEVTNDLPYNLLFATQLLLAESCDADHGFEISEANGYNLDNVMHHGTAGRSGVLVVEADTARHYVILAAWAKTWSPLWQPTDTIRVESDYGRLAVLRWPAP